MSFDCGDNSCRYATKKTGMRTNGGCRCDSCPACGQYLTQTRPSAQHREWCTDKDWLPPWRRKETP